MIQAMSGESKEEILRVVDKKFSDLGEQLGLWHNDSNGPSMAKIGHQTAWHIFKTIRQREREGGAKRLQEAKNLQREVAKLSASVAAIEQDCGESGHSSLHNTSLGKAGSTKRKTAIENVDEVIEELRMRSKRFKEI